MFSDTHFHFNLLEENSRTSILEKMSEQNTFFGLDIGTNCDDLKSRQVLAETSIKKIVNPNYQKKAFDFFYFSAGIWPWPKAIQDRKNQMQILESQLNLSLNSENSFFRKIIAIGECGIDHHWNPSGADGRCENDFDKAMFNGEKEMFMMQLELAKKYSLPVIVHSRDAFAQTLECIKNCNYDNGIIHCYSYGLEEAKSFLERGWYLAFGGGVTYTKKSKLQQMSELLRYVPKDRLLLETDAPYLAPVPFRGTLNTPLLIEHSYKFIADIRCVELEELCTTVDENIKKLFQI